MELEIKHGIAQIRHLNMVERCVMIVLIRKQWTKLKKCGVVTSFVQVSQSYEESLDKEILVPSPPLLNVAFCIDFVYIFPWSDEVYFRIKFQLGLTLMKIWVGLNNEDWKILIKTG